MTALTLAQGAAGDGSDTAIIAAVVTAVGLVLAALVSLFGLRSGARLDAIEKAQGSLGAAIERLERRMEDGLARLADRIDRLYGSASAGPTTTTLPPAETTTSTIEARMDDLTERLRDFVVHAPPPPQLKIDAAELNAQVEALRRAVEAYSEQERQADGGVES